MRRCVSRSLNVLSKQQPSLQVAAATAAAVRAPTALLSSSTVVSASRVVSRSFRSTGADDGWNSRPAMVGDSTITCAAGGPMSGANIATDVAAMGMKDPNYTFLNRWMVTHLLLAKKCEKESTFVDLSKQVGLSEVFVTAAIMGQHTLAPNQTHKLLVYLGLEKQQKLHDRIVRVLAEPPLRGSLIPTIPTDPTIYRFYEILQVYGTTFKALIHEKCGDGVMSSVDFCVKVDVNPKGREGSWVETMRGDRDRRDQRSDEQQDQRDQQDDMMMNNSHVDRDAEKCIAITLMGKFLPYKKF